jgi:hypothetical protein
LPSLSTATPGDFSRISSTFNPALVGEASTFTSVLPARTSIGGLFAVTTTPAIDSMWAASSIVFNVIFKALEETSTVE